jgi:hypothetical protein
MLAQPLQPTPGVQQRLLENVFGIVHVADVIAYQRCQRLLVAPDKLNERAGIARRAAPGQFGIAWFRQGATTSYSDKEMPKNKRFTFLEKKYGKGKPVANRYRT